MKLLLCYWRRWCSPGTPRSKRCCWECIHRCCRCWWLSLVLALRLWQLPGNFTVYLVGDSLVLIIFLVVLCDLGSFYKRLIIFFFQIEFFFPHFHMEWGRHVILNCLPQILRNSESSYGPTFPFCVTWESRCSGLFEFIQPASWNQLLYRGVFPGLLWPFNLW